MDLHLFVEIVDHWLRNHVASSSQAGKEVAMFDGRL